MNERISFIDFAKGFSIFAIIIYHYCLPLDYGWFFKQVISFGGTGIHLFFFLSGFGLGLGRKKPILAFYKRRFIKILLPYYIFITSVYVINIVLPIYPESDLMTYLSHIFLFKMFFGEYISSFGYQLWFISTIVQFYLFFPIMRWINEKFGHHFFIITAFISSLAYIIFISITGHGAMRVWQSFFLSYYWEFALGFLIATNQNPTLFINFKTWQYLLVLTIGLILMGVLSSKFGQTGRLFNDFPALFAFTSFVILVYRVSSKKIFDWLHHFFLSIGSVSYEIYLVHYLFFSIFLLLIKHYQISYSPLHIPFLFLIIWMVSLVFQRFLLRLENKMKNIN